MFSKQANIQTSSRSQDEVLKNGVELNCRVGKEEESIEGIHQSPESSSVCVVLPSDRTSISGYLYTLLQQVVPVRLTEEMIALGKSKSRKNLPIGHPGLMCRHCMGGAKLKSSKVKLVSPATAITTLGGKKTKCSDDGLGTQPGAFSVRKPKRMHIGDGTGTYFATCVDELEKRCHAIYKHVIGCPLCPENIRKEMEFHEAVHKAEMTQLPRGAQKSFLRLVWNRLHNAQKQVQNVSTLPSSKGEEGRKLIAENSTTSTSNGSLQAHKEAVSSPCGMRSSIQRAPLAAAEGELSRLTLSSSGNSVQSRDTAPTASNQFLPDGMVYSCSSSHQTGFPSSQSNAVFAALEQQRLAFEFSQVQAQAKARQEAEARARQEAQARALLQAQAQVIQQAQAQALQQAQIEAALQREIQAQARDAQAAEAIKRAVTNPNLYQQLLQRQALIESAGLNQTSAMAPNLASFDALASLTNIQKDPTAVLQLQQALARQQNNSSLMQGQGRFGNSPSPQPIAYGERFDRHLSKRQNRNHSPDRSAVESEYSHSRDFRTPRNRPVDDKDASSVLENLLAVAREASTNSAPKEEATLSNHKSKFIRVSHGWSCEQCCFVPFDLRAPGSLYAGKNHPPSRVVEEHMKLCKGGRFDLTEIIKAVDGICQTVPGFTIDVLGQSSFKRVVSALVGHNEKLVTVFTDGVRAERLGVISDGGGKDGLWTGFPGRVDADEALSAVAAFLLTESHFDASFVDNPHFRHFVKILIPGCDYTLPRKEEISLFL